MTDTTRTVLITAGIGLVTVGVAPTPDDITIVSPLAQIAIGTALILVGVYAK